MYSLNITQKLTFIWNRIKQNTSTDRYYYTIILNATF